MSARDLFTSPAVEDDGEWLSVSDLMAGLMVIFLFIAVVFIRPLAEENRELSELQSKLESQVLTLEEQRTALAEQAALVEAQAEELAQRNAQMTEIAVTWQAREAEIYQALVAEFEDDLPRWNAEIEKETLLIRFNAPEVLFEAGDDTIRPGFAAMLSDFFPRYAAVLTPFRDVLEEIRIEGHTSSEWSGATPRRAYIENMRLSQDRTRMVLDFVLGLVAVAEDRGWLQGLMTANGLSSSRLVLGEGDREDADRSRRVEFRIRTTARGQIVRILDAAR